MLSPKHILEIPSKALLLSLSYYHAYTQNQYHTYTLI